MSFGERKDKILIGVDFGTTFSGASWCFTGTPEKIKTVRWPGTNKSLAKVPSVVQYSKDVSRCKWGFEVNPESTGTQTPLAWFKLLLDKGADTNRIAQLRELQANLDALPQKKTPVDLITDYLRGIYQHTLHALKKDYPEIFSIRIGKEIPLKIVLTVPAVWSDSAKEQTLQAARAAGMDEKYAKITLVSEPEAAAIHCFRAFKETPNSLQVGDVYVIADCGGGTVDLISYEITAVEPRLRVNECVVGTGGFCGSTELNRRFELLVKSKIGESSFDSLTGTPRLNMMRHFDEFLKPTFCPSDEDGDDFDIDTYHCLVPGLPDCSKKGISHGNLVLSVEDMKEIFDPTFSEITKLVQDQVTNAEITARKPVTGVLLVGGFGSSSYLEKHLSATIKDKKGNAVKILQPEDAWTAIMRGAVLYGLSLDHDANTMLHIPSVDNRRARFSYGVSASESFDPSVHPSKNLYIDSFTGNLLCPNRMQWFVQKGEEIPNDRPIKVSLIRKCGKGSGGKDLIFAERIFCSSSDSPPSDTTDPDVKRLLVYTSDLNGVPRKRHFIRKRGIDGDIYWEIPFFMLMKYQSASLEFSSEVGGSSCGKGSVQYNHEAP